MSSAWAKNLSRGEQVAQAVLRNPAREPWSATVDRYVRQGLTVSGGSAAPSNLSPMQLNGMQRAAVLASAVEMTNQVFSQTVAAPTAGNNIINIPVRPVGLVKHFILEVSGTYTSGAAAAATILGLANLVSNIQVTDLQNNIRINTTGFHLAVLEQVKTRSKEPASRPVTTALSDSLIAGEYVAAGSAPNFPVILYPVPNTTTGTFRLFLKIPLAYSDNDLRGAIYANIINAQMNIQVTLNPNPAGTASDLTNYVWGNDTGAITNVNLTCYQVYLDQLPVGNNGVVLPVLDLSTVYELKYTNFTGMTAGQEFSIPFANFRDFLSTLVVFNSTGATAGLKNGSDVSYWSLQSANFTNIWKIDPLFAALKTRQIIGSDLPVGCYYFSYRRKPWSTTQYGNLQLILNPASVSGVPYAVVYWEDFAQQNTLTQAGSLAS